MVFQPVALAGGPKLLTEKVSKMLHGILDFPDYLNDYQLLKKNSAMWS
jgi:hypothetical protein